jgi:O-antigen/teichoic acid export membrane protein
MRFELLSITETMTALAQILGTLALALLGLGYWALVVGNLISTAALAKLNVAWRACAFALPHLRSIRRALRFSCEVLTARLAWNFYSDADFLVAGRVLGAVRPALNGSVAMAVLVGALK